MANTTLAEVLPLFTRVNTALVKRLEILEKKTGVQSLNPKQEKIVQDTQPVEIESFGHKALNDINKAFKLSVNITDKDKDKKPKDTIDWLSMFKNAALVTGIGLLLKKFFIKININ